MNIFEKIISFLMIIIIATTLMAKLKNKVYASSSLNTNNINTNTNTNTINAGVLLYNFEDMYISQIKQSLEDIQKKNQNTVNFTFFNSKANRAIQNQNLDSLLNGNFNLLLLNLVSPSKDELINIINKARKNDISLIIFNIDPSIVPQVENIYNKVVFITTDSTKLGTLQGKILVDEWNTNKSAIDKNKDDVLQYILLQGRPDTTIPIKRTQAAISTIESAGIKTQQLDLVTAYWDKELAKSAVNAMVLKYGNKIEAIISNNDAMAIGAVKALQQYGYNTGDNSKYISVVGIDGLQEAKDLIDRSLMTGTVTQSPTDIAEALHKIGMNLVNNLNPIANTNYKIVAGQIIILDNYEQYIKK